MVMVSQNAIKLRSIDAYILGFFGIFVQLHSEGPHTLATTKYRLFLKKIVDIIKMHDNC